MAKSDKEMSYRSKFRVHLLQNPNYFGNLSKLDISDLPKPVFKKISDTYYEELTCIGFDPDTDVLAATVRVKQPSGYSGGPCTDGSDEYIRFYVDYGNGTWVDSGMASFNIHDLGYKEDLCYAVAIALKPKKRVGCKDKPILPKVRAILSWENIPPANTPNWTPVWGNVLERDIQLDPWDLLIGTIKDFGIKPGVAQIDPNILKQLEKAVAKQPPTPKPVQAVAELMKDIDPKDELQVLRNVFPILTSAVTKKSSDVYVLAKDALSALDIDISKYSDFLLKPKFNTSYEELHCVGLDRDANRLYAIIEVKKPYGYSGGLCHKGSQEHVAFYLDFGGGWEYQDTGSVTVHNIPGIPSGGLWYQVSIPVDLEKHRKEWCKTDRARIRGILSWNTAPVPYDPDHVAHWGDWEDCWIEIEPLPEGVEEGVFLPVLQSIGNMAVTKINPAGYATGSSLGSTFTAEDSPFGGRTLLKGAAFFAPPGTPLEYQIMLDDLSGSGPLPFTDWFWASVTTFPSVLPSDVKQIPTGGWFQYLPSPTVMVADGLLGVLKGLPNGPHDVHLIFRNASTLAVLGQTAPKRFMVDNTRPVVDVEITSGAGNCGKFTIGEVLLGTFEITDEHCKTVALSVTPSAEAAGGLLFLKNIAPPALLPPPAPAPTATNALTYDQTLTGSGTTTGEWELHTTNMDPCGYNIRVHGVDRTIVNSGGDNWEDWDIEGFCLENPA